MSQNMVPGLVNIEKNYGKIHHAILMGKSTISMAMFNSYVKLPEGISILIVGTTALQNMQCYIQLQHYTTI